MHPECFVHIRPLVKMDNIPSSAFLIIASVPSTLEEHWDIMEAMVSVGNPTPIRLQAAHGCG